MTADVFLLSSQTETSVSAVCRTLQLARSSVYARRKRQPSARARDTAVLDVEIKAEFEVAKRRYGSPRLHRTLQNKGRRVSRKRVAARMQAMKLQARRPKRFRRTTQADASHTPAPNLLDRRFDWALPNQAWAGDITFIWTLAGWVYLAILVDLCTRAIVGWSVGKTCDAALAREALDRAVARHQPAPGLLQHTDRGSTYTARLYRDALKAYGMRESMSRKGNCWDNAVAESTFATIKAEAFDDVIAEDVHEVQRILFTYIERFYNRQRLHSSNGYLTPADKERLTTISIAA